MSTAKPRLVDTGRGLTIYYKNRHLYSTRDPEGSARRQAAAATLLPGSLVFVPSLGLGYGLRELLGSLPESCHLLCVEVDQPLMALAREAGAPLPVDPRLTVLRAVEPGAVVSALRALGVWRFRRLVAVPLGAGQQLYPEAYRSIREALEEEIRLFWQNKMTLLGMARLWLKNLFLNLELLPGAPAVAALRTPRPVVVAGAGPSLEESLPRIAAVRERVHLLAADTALAALADAGLRPDSVCVLEAQSHNLDDFVPCFDPSLPLVCDLTASPTVLRHFPRRHFFSSRFHPLALFDRLQRHGILPLVLPPLGSVGVAAVRLALELTGSAVLLAGLDFSYRPGKTHARGTPPLRRELRQGRRTHPPGMAALAALLGRPRLELQDAGGRPVSTDLVLRSYALQLRSLIAGSRRVYSLSAGGISSGAQPLDTEDALRQLLVQVEADGGAAPSLARSSAPAARGPALPAFSSAPRVEQVAAFCAAEIDLLEGAERRLAGLLGGNAAGGAPAEEPAGSDAQEVHLQNAPAAPGGTGAPADGARQADDAAQGSIDVDAGAPADAPAGGLPPWLAEVEYLLLHLPEVDPQRLLEAGNLGQARLAARYFASLLRRVQAGLG